MYNDWTYLQLLTEIHRRGLLYSTARRFGRQDEEAFADMREALESDDRRMSGPDFKPHCPDCLDGAVPAYLPYGQKTPYHHCRNCGYTFLPAQAVLLRDLPPVEGPTIDDLMPQFRLTGILSTA